MELKLCEPQEACYRRIHTQSQLLKVPMVKSYDMLKSGYLYGEYFKKNVFNDKIGVFPDVM